MNAGSTFGPPFRAQDFEGSIVVVDDSVIMPGDKNRLADMGIAAVFGPGVPDEQIIETIRRIA